MVFHSIETKALKQTFQKQLAPVRKAAEVELIKSLIASTDLLHSLRSWDSVVCATDQHVVPLHLTRDAAAQKYDLLPRPGRQ